MATVFRDVVYGSHPNQQVNLYQPDNYDFITDLGRDLTGVILWLHGGGWAGGHKDLAADNFTNGQYILAGDISVYQAIINAGGELDDDACKTLADLGYFVISANYRLISAVAGASVPTALNPGGGEYPGSVEDIRELYKYMTLPGYAAGANSATWDLIVRHTHTLGLMIIGGSAGGHLAVAGVFEGAGNTGQWPRGLCNVVGPMNLYYDANNPIGESGRSLIDRLTSGTENNQKLASPWWKRDSVSDPSTVGYENYLGFSDTANPSVSYNKMKMWFWYNQNDLLVPTTNIEPFIDWARSALGNDKVYAENVDVLDPDSLSQYRGVWNASTAYTGGNGVLSDVVFFSGRMYKADRTVPVGTAPTDPPDGVNWSYGLDATHNLPPTLSVATWAQDAVKFVYYSGVNFPKFQHRLRPTQGIMYPRTRNINYNPPPPSYVLTAGAASANEGSTATFTLITVGIAPNTVLYYTLSGVVAADITGGATSGTLTTNSSGQGTINIGLVADITTEGPEIMTVSVRTTSFSGTVVASASITVNDTSVNNEVLSISPSTVDPGQSFTTTSTGGQPNTGYSVSWTRDGVAQPSFSGSSTLDSSGNASDSSGNFNLSGFWVLTINYAGSGNVRTASVTVNVMTPQFTVIPASINEGSTGSFTVINLGEAGTYYWTINNVTTNNADFNAVSGNFNTATLNGSGTFTINTIADATTEGAQTFTVSVRSGSVNGTIIVTSGTITVNDTSVTVYNEVLSISPSTVNLGQSFTTTSTGGQPNTGYSVSWTRNGVAQPSFSGSSTLDSSGNASDSSGSFNLSGSWVLTINYAGSGNVRTANLTVNAESVSIPGSVQAYQLFTISASGAVPNTGFSFIWYRNGVTQSSGSLTVDSSGNYSSGNGSSLNIAGNWTLQVTFTTSGNVITRSITVYETLSISPTTVSVNQSFTVTTTGGVPNSGFSLVWRRSGVTVLSGSSTLDGSGNFSAPGAFDTAGFYILTLTFTSTGNTATASVNVV